MNAKRVFWRTTELFLKRNYEVLPQAQLHLLPLMVIAGAAGEDRGRVAFSDTYGGFRVSALHFGGAGPSP